MDNLGKEHFIDEAIDLIASLEHALLQLDNEPENQEQIALVFRIMHTFKGTSAMFGFAKLGEYTHHLETIYDFVREGKIKITEKLLNLTLFSVDHLKKLLEDPELENAYNAEKHEQSTQNLITFIEEIKDVDFIKANKKSDALNAKHSNTDELNKTVTISKKTFHIIFKPNANIFKRCINILGIFDELFSLGDCKIFVNTKNIPAFNDYDYENCYLSWNILLSTNESQQRINEVFLFTPDENEIFKIWDKNIFDIPEIHAVLNKFNESPGDFNLNEIIPLLEVKKDAVSIDRLVVEAKDFSENKNFRNDRSRQSIRISSEKLDDLMNLVSELVTSQAELTVVSEEKDLAKLPIVAENIEKISRRLRDTALNVCLIPIEELNTYFKRLVRDLSIELKKEINFITEGTETELDKRVIDNLKEPFLHVIRNAIDHGIGSPESRVKLGKSAHGTIKLKAYYSGTNVYIEISDDGNGLDKVKIREKAIAKGLISADAQLNEKEIMNLVFLPGFSTAEQVTKLSGRGVGMDVVKRKIAEINGEVEIDSVQNEGTTVTVKLPLTLSIVDALLVKVDDLHLLIPLAIIDRCEEASHETIVNAINNRLVFEEELIPFIYLRHEFSINNNPLLYERIVIVKHRDIKVGIVVDSVVGQHQAVLKPLSEIFKCQDIVSGASILGNGKIAQILDIDRLVESIKKVKV